MKQPLEVFRGSKELWLWNKLQFSMVFRSWNDSVIKLIVIDRCAKKENKGFTSLAGTVL